MKEITLEVHDDITLADYGDVSIITPTQDFGKCPEGTVVHFKHTDKNKSCTGILTTGSNCNSCVFRDYELCPIVLGHGCIACALSGLDHSCVIMDVGELI